MVLRLTTLDSRLGCFLAGRQRVGGESRESKLESRGSALDLGDVCARPLMSFASSHLLEAHSAAKEITNAIRLRKTRRLSTLPHLGCSIDHIASALKRAELAPLADQLVQLIAVVTDDLAYGM